MKITEKSHQICLSSSVLLLLFIVFSSTVSVTAAQSSSSKAYAYVPNFLDNTVSVIDTDTNTVTSTVMNIKSGPLGVAITPDGTKVYVANKESNTVSVIDTATETIITVSVGNSPYGIAVTPNERKVYVTNYGDATVSVIDTSTNTVIAMVNVGSNPLGVAVAGIKAYVTNDLDKTVSVIDTTKDTVVATVPIEYESPGGVAANRDGTTVYVTSGSSNIISVIDTATNKVTSTVSVGDHPWGIAVSPDGSRVYVTNSGSNDVSVIDASTNKVIDTVKVGSHPCGVAVTPDAEKVYVANLWDNTVSVIDTTANTVTKNVKVGRSPKVFGQFTGYIPVTEEEPTENKDLPTKEEITDFIAGIPVSDNYIYTVFDAVIDKHPTWHCATWEDKNGNQILSLYYVDPESAKGYDSIYFNELGEEISMPGVEVELVNKYIGKAVSEESYVSEDSYDTTIANNYDNSQTNTQTTTVNNYYSKEPENTQEEPEETSTDQTEKVSASVDLHGEKTKVLKGEDILLKLSAVNFVTKPTMHVQAIIIPPSGMSVSSSEFVESGTGQYTTTYDIEPGKGRDIEVRIAANQVGDFTVTGKVVYYFGSNKEDGEYYTLDLPIQVEDSTPETPVSEDKSVTIPIPDTPGFGAQSLLFVLLLVFIFRRNN